MDQPFVAHYRTCDKQPQMVREHLSGVKKLAEYYGHHLGVGHITGLAGMLHDLGKYTDHFQNYLKQAVFHPENPPKRGSVDHASAGGKLLFEKYHESRPRDQLKMILAEVVGNAIISHHSYLHDFLNFELESPYLRRVTKQEDQLPEYSKARHVFFNEVLSPEAFDHYVDRAVDELKIYINANKGNIMEKLTLLNRFVFSVLIDADRTNTCEFEENTLAASPTATIDLFHTYTDKLLRYLDSLNQKPESKSTINQLRKEMSLQCDQFALRPSGIYTLSIPTGGGKTLASLRYALKHAQLYKKKRIIYIIPYTTIIEQNAKVIRSIIEDDEHILEHHSNVVEIDEDMDHDSDDGTMSVREKLELAKDNWDCPIILTTMVQFLDTFYKLGSQNIRRLHHLTESVIIFDEVQKVPIHCVTLFNQALNFLKTFGQSCILLCTATQPALDYVKHRLDINRNGEIVGNINQVADAFKRVEIVDRSYNEKFSNDRLADFIQARLNMVKNILVILNTRSVVRSLYQKLNEGSDDVAVFHLSTSMCAAHRDRILGKIKDALVKNKKVVCISTQLIEAGVDISFECVIRSLAGLDSIAQAAGRCNRHGEYDGLRQVYIIDHADEKLGASALETIRIGKSISKQMLADMHRDPKKFSGDILSKSALDWYFKCYFKDVSDKTDFKLKSGGHMTDLLCAGQRNSSLAKAYRDQHDGHSVPLCQISSLHTAAEKFYVIKNMTKSVIVPYGEGKEIIARLSSAETIEDLSKLLRKAQHYSINLYDQEDRQLSQEKQISCYFENQIRALNEAAYSDEYGLDIKGEGELKPYQF